MKTFITFPITLIFSTLSHFISGADKPEPTIFTKAETAIQHYITATQLGETDDLEYLFTEQLRISTPDNTDSKSFDRSALIKHLKENQGNKLDVISELTILENHSHYSVAQIRTTFDHFVRLDYLTLQNGKNGWKISNIVVTYP
ncbi:MAG: nuclear transport factor 2 family protein [Sphingobacterium sp.]